jgi:hypothetical protein
VARPEGGEKGVDRTAAQVEALTKEADQFLAAARKVSSKTAA